MRRYHFIIVCIEANLSCWLKKFFIFVNARNLIGRQIGSVAFLYIDVNKFPYLILTQSHIQSP